MKRPSLQFYPGDWQGNTKLRRCSHAEKGIWIDVMCLMHDSEEYGVLRWPLQDIAQAVGCRVADLRTLQAKGVLKGADTSEQCAALVYTPRHAGKDGASIILVPGQTGPVWYSSRMVADEYVRGKRGIGTRFGDQPNPTPKPPIGERMGDAPKVELKVKPMVGFGDGPSSSSSTSLKEKNTKKEFLQKTYPETFLRFWEAFPRQRRGNQHKAFLAWQAATQRATPDAIIASCRIYATSAEIANGFAKGAAAWLNDDRWTVDYSAPPAFSFAAHAKPEMKKVGSL